MAPIVQRPEPGSCAIRPHRRVSRRRSPRSWPRSGGAPRDARARMRRRTIDTTGRAAGHAVRPVSRAPPGRVEAPVDEGQDRIAELETQVDRLERDLAQSRELRREAVAARDAQAAKLRQSREECASSGGDEPSGWPCGSRIATGRGRREPSGAGGAASARRDPPSRARGGTWRADSGRSPGAERELAAAIRGDLTPATVDGGPLVSIVILNRDGRALLERCLRAVARRHTGTSRSSSSTTARPRVGGAGGGHGPPFPLRVIRNTENRSFSDANDQAATIAERRTAVLPQQRRRADHRGLARVHGRDPDDDRGGGRRGPADLPVESRRQAGGGALRRPDAPASGRGIRTRRGGAAPRVIGAGEDPRGRGRARRHGAAGPDRGVSPGQPAGVEAVGGFGSEYDYGLEDVDLGLNLRASGGRLVYDGRAALWQHESATRVRRSGGRRSRVARNREAYVDDWGPRIFRDALLDALDGGEQFSDAPFHVAIVGTGDTPQALPARGLRRSAARCRSWDGGSGLPEADADGALALDPSVEAAIIVEQRRQDLGAAAPSRLACVGRRRSRALAGERPWFVVDPRKRDETAPQLPDPDGAVRR